MVTKHKERKLGYYKEKIIYGNYYYFTWENRFYYLYNNSLLH